MAVDIVLIVLLLMLLINFAYLRRIKKRRNKLGVSSGRVVYQDTLERTDQTLYSHRLGLAGRPDNILRQGKYYIPLEVKAGRTPKAPYPNQIMQVVAYCGLVEDAFKVRPPHGILLYQQTNTEFMVEYTQEREQELLVLLQDMKRKRVASDVHRSHNNPRVCTACGYKEICEECLV